MSGVPCLLSTDPASPFPDPARALRRPDGLLAVGGDLSPVRLANAYRAGIFPWYSEGQPILWWSPDPRTVFRTDAVHLPRRFRRTLRGSDWVVVADRDFAAVVDACATAPRAGQDGTWITRAMRDAYAALHAVGLAHSIEVRDGDDRLVGGLYGVAVGRMFFGESMVSLRSGGSKVALAALALRMSGWGWPLLDAQVDNPHLRALGAGAMPRDVFLEAIGTLVARPGVADWPSAFGRLPARVLSDRPDA
ncbi:leucyl/phenylalanyl-tRNA--protein transferase [Luteimonas pelagia]